MLFFVTYCPFCQRKMLKLPAFCLEDGGIPGLLVSNLDFNDMVVSRNDEPFIKFVNNVRLLRSDPIKKFRIRVTRLIVDADFIYSWISTALKHNVEEHDLGFHFNSLVRLPGILMKCKTIKILKLHSRCIVPSTESVCLPSPQVLHLDQLPSSSHVSRFLSGSPVLEEFFFEGHPSDYFESTLSVRSTLLKRLIIHQTKMDSKRNNNCYKVVVDAPKLEFLELKDHLSEEFIVIEASSLAIAKIDVRQHHSHTKSPYDYGYQVHQLLQKISSVKELTISETALQATQSAILSETALQATQLATKTCFSYLTQLELRGVGTGWQLLSDILNCSPKLQALILSKDDDNKGSNAIPAEAIFDKLSVPQCLMTTSEKLEYKGFNGNTTELEIVEYFLMNGTVLKNVIISLSLSAISSGQESVVLKKLIKFARASNACQIIFI